MEDLCGSCSRCIDACPTGAIVDARVVDARRCLSYLTIELRSSVPSHLREAMGNHLFGCDVCQEVCPWNHRVPAAREPELRAGRAVEETTLEEVVRMDAPAFSARFRGSAISRTKRNGLVRNALIVAANTRDGAALRAGRAVLEDPEPMLREAAVWALARGEAPDRSLAVHAAERETDPALRACMMEEIGRAP